MWLLKAYKVPTQHDWQTCPRALLEACLPISGYSCSSSPISRSALTRQCRGSKVMYPILEISVRHV